MPLHLNHSSLHDLTHTLYFVMTLSLSLSLSHSPPSPLPLCVQAQHAYQNGRWDFPSVQVKADLSLCSSFFLLSSSLHSILSAFCIDTSLVIIRFKPAYWTLHVTVMAVAIVRNNCIALTFHALFYINCQWGGFSSGKVLCASGCDSLVTFCFWLWFKCF